MTQTLTPQPARPAKSGCGCTSFLFGCFFGILLVFGSVIGGGVFIFQNRFEAVDWGVKYVYPHVIRPEIAKNLQDLPLEERQAILQRLDNDVEGYLALPESDKKKVREKVVELIKSLQTNPSEKDVKLKEIEALIQELQP